VARIVRYCNNHNPKQINVNTIEMYSPDLYFNNKAQNCLRIYSPIVNLRLLKIQKKVTKVYA